MLTATRLCPNQEEIAAEILDGEAIIINLATGSYYSMADAAALVWHAVEQHCSLEETALRLAAHYDVPLERAREDVAALAARLLAEKIAVPSDANACRGDAPAAPSQRLAYAAPALSVYSDMRNLLALDPPIPSVGALERGGDKQGR